MIKFLVKCFLIFSPLLLVAQDLGSENLPFLINELTMINHQEHIIKDQNTSVADLQALKDKKAKLLVNAPLFVTEYQISKKDIIEFNKQKSALISKISSYSKKPNSKQYIETKFDMINLKIDEAFYSTVLEISDIFKDNGKKDQIDSALQNGILAIQTTAYLDIKNLKDSLLESVKSDYDMEFINLEIKKETYEEILAYLQNHSDSLTGNFLFNSLNLKDFINFINKLTPIPENKFNFGKFVLIIIIFLFFLSIRRVISRIMFAILSIFLSKDKKTHGNLQEQFIAVIKKPISAFVITYSIDICLNIFYYPSPVPIKFANYFTIAYIILIAWIIIETLDGYGIVLLSKLAKKSGRKEVVNLIIKILYFIVVLISILIVLSRLGFDISTLIASLGIGGLAVALATKDIIANFFASILLLFDNSFSQGDWIVCGDIEGTVVETGLRKTAIRTFDNALVFVPNSKIMSENIKNWNRRKIGRQIKMLIGIEYSSSPEQVLKCVNDIKYMLQNHPGIARSGEDTALNSSDLRIRYRQNVVSVDDLAGYKSNLFVVLDSFGESSINILIYCFTKSVIWGEFLATKQDVMIKMMEILDKNGAGFAFPSQSLYIEKLPQEKT